MIDRRVATAFAVGLALVSAAALTGLVTGCEDEEVAQQRCIAPLVALIRWRDGVETELRFRGLQMAPGELATAEREQVAATVAALRDERTRCALTWSVLLMQPPDNPALRLREEAILTLRGAALRAYPAEAVGAAGVSLNGSPPSGGPPPPTAPPPVPPGVP